MAYEEFKEQLLTEIRAIAGERIVWIEEHPENRMAETICIQIAGMLSACQCPLKEYTEQYYNGKPIPQIAREILDACGNSGWTLAWAHRQIESMETARPFLRFRLMNANNPTIERRDVLHESFLDMKVVLYLHFPAAVDTENGVYLYVSRRLAANWGNKTFQELFKIALHNMQENEPISLETTEETYNRICKEAQAAKYEIPFHLTSRALQRSAMHNLSTKNRKFGAACIVYPNALKEVANRLNDNLYILPADANAWCIMPETEWTDLLWMAVYDMRAQQDIEQLTTNVYYYNRKTDALSIVHPK